MPNPKDNIKHLIVLMLENRSFDHMLGYSGIPGIDGLQGNESNLDSSGNAITVSMDAKYAGDYRVDPGHHFPDVTEQLFEKPQVPSTAKPTMGGFVKNYQAQPGGSLVASRRVMKCFDPRKLPALTGLAKEYAICDRWFSSVPGPTLPNRAFAHAATSLGHVDMNPIAYWNIVTLYERLNDEGVSSRVYSHDGNTLAFMFKSLFKKGGKYLGTYAKKLNMKVDGSDLRSTDVDPNTHGTATLSDQQRNQVLAAYMMDLDQPAVERVIGNTEFKVLEEINTEQKAAEYIKRVAKSLEIV